MSTINIETNYEHKEFQKRFNKSIKTYKIYCDVVSFYQEKETQKVLYKIFLKSEITQNEWEVNRRFSDFTEYHSILSQNFYDIPSLPGKSLIKITSLPELEKRKEELNKFIKVSQ